MGLRAVLGLRWRRALAIFGLVAGLAAACGPIDAPTAGPPAPVATPAPARPTADPPRPPTLAPATPPLVPAAPTAAGTDTPFPLAGAATLPPALRATATWTPLAAVPLLTTPPGAGAATWTPLAAVPLLTAPPGTVAANETPPFRSAVPLVALDPGHGGQETGAVSASGLAEKDVNLAIALAVAVRLRAAGVAVLLTRAVDGPVNTRGVDVNGNGTIDVDDDLQARVDAANTAGAWLLVSIHNNADPGSPATEGTTTYYCVERPFAAASLRLAQTLHTHLLSAIRATGYPATDRHVRDDIELRKPGGHLYLLGPHNKRITRPSLMPGALGETLFLSNAADAAQLARPAMIAAIAQGYADGILAYLGEGAGVRGRGSDELAVVPAD
ncbi:MAG TPA: N-acetylmuramoyl-L-alanine amidase [Chloroflexia bacterium]|nr:N-acetylmuramoyl-L-alanine amidase [Chloroflexia bacterium]